MKLLEYPIFRWLGITYKPCPEVREFESSLVSQEQNGVEVQVAVLDAQRESRKFFGVPMARRGMQPVWVRVVNRSERPYRLLFLSLDPNYFSPLEAAALNHFSSGKRLLGFGLAALLFLPIFILLLPIKLFAVSLANRKLDAFFREHAFAMRPVLPGGEQAGFVYTNLSEGSKVVPVRLLSTEGSVEFEFTIQIEGLNTDHLRREGHDLQTAENLQDVDVKGLGKYLATAPQATANHRGTRAGDPVNLVVVGDFSLVIGAFGARWDETEVISLETCWKTFKAFFTGAEYRYSPVSGLYLFKRTQDFALQRIRDSINERLHLRLWATPLRLRGQCVWIGQVSRDIGVRLTWRTWNLTTHRIDPEVDEARDYVLEDLIQLGRLEMAGYVDGVGPCDRTAPRHNLTGDPYYTDGKRAVVLLSETQLFAKIRGVDLTVAAGFLLHRLAASGANHPNIGLGTLTKPICEWRETG